MNLSKQPFAGLEGPEIARLSLAGRVLAAIVEHKQIFDGAWPPDLWVLNRVNIGQADYDVILAALVHAGALYRKGDYYCIKGGKWSYDDVFPVAPLVRLGMKKGKDDALQG